MDNLFSTHPSTENRVAALEKLSREMGLDSFGAEAPVDYFEITGSVGMSDFSIHKSTHARPNGASYGYQSGAPKSSSGKAPGRNHRNHGSVVRTGYRYVKVRGLDRGVCILRFDEIGDQCELIMFSSARIQGLATRAT